jgi:pimeloyl-ACP methyl ester carboxylesterase
VSLEILYDEGIRYSWRKPSSETGVGQTILLLHGLGNSLDFWTTTAPLIDERHGVLAMDIPGFGRSIAPPGGMTISSVSDRILQFLDHKGLRPPVVVGHSLGAFVALELAALSPHMFRRIILVSGTLLKAAELLRSPRKALLSPGLALAVANQFVGGIVPLRHVPIDWILKSKLVRLLALWPFVAHPASLDPAVLARALSNTGGMGVLRVLSQAHSFNLIATMENAKQPVDLIWGALDRLISAQDVRLARTLLNVKRSQAIPDCGHWPMIEQPALLAGFISEWDLVHSGE